MWGCGVWGNGIKGRGFLPEHYYIQATHRKDACLWRLSISACCIMLYIICLKICRLSAFVIIFAVEVVIVR